MTLLRSFEKTFPFRLKELVNKIKINNDIYDKNLLEVRLSVLDKYGKNMR
jgi:hypothetical protein